jgi:nitrate reductase NapAB chaperone NapD
MTIQSYLIYAERGRTKQVAEQLRAIPGCEIFPSASHDVLVVVTESPGQEAPPEIFEHVPGVAGIALVSGWTE